MADASNSATATVNPVSGPAASSNSSGAGRGTKRSPKKTVKKSGGHPILEPKVPAAKNRVAKRPAARRAPPIPTAANNDLLAEAQRETDHFLANPPLATSSNSITVASFSWPRVPVPPPRPAKDVFPVLPEASNPIDRAIFARLAECWDEESGAWTEAMQRSLLENLPRARVTRSTATFANHYIARTLRQGGGAVPSWGQFVVLRVMFGPAACFRQSWADELGKRYPIARQDAWDAVVPDDLKVVRRVLDGEDGMPVPRRRKVSIMTLRKEYTRKRSGGAKKGNREATKEKEKEDEGGEIWANQGLLTPESEGLGSGESRGTGGEVVEVSEAAWMQAASTASSMDPRDVIEKMKGKYHALNEEIKALEKSKEEIRSWLVAYTKMVELVKDEDF